MRSQSSAINGQTVGGVTLFYALCSPAGGEVQPSY